MHRYNVKENQDMVRCEHGESKRENESLATSEVQSKFVEGFSTPLFILQVQRKL